MSDPTGERRAAPADRPPISLVVAAALIALISVAALVVAGFRPPASVIGWVLAGPVAVSLLVAYGVRQAVLRAQPSYSEAPGLTTIYRVGLGITCAAILVNALSIGLWIGSL